MQSGLGVGLREPLFLIITLRNSFQVSIIGDAADFQGWLPRRIATWNTVLRSSFKAIHVKASLTGCITAGCTTGLVKPVYCEEEEKEEVQCATQTTHQKPHILMSSFAEIAGAPSVLQKLPMFCVLRGLGSTIRWSACCKRRGSVFLFPSFMSRDRPINQVYM